MEPSSIANATARGPRRPRHLTRRSGRTATNNRNSPRSSSKQAGTGSKKQRDCCAVLDYRVREYFLRLLNPTSAAYRLPQITIYGFGETQEPPCVDTAVRGIR